MEIIWEEVSSEQLQDIIDYYLEKDSPRAAEKILEKIEEAVSRLIIFPCMGSVEIELEGLSHIYRSILAHPHYKIIYRVAEDYIYIAGVWDCRQDPQRMKSQIKKR